MRRPTIAAFAALLLKLTVGLVAAQEPRACLLIQHGTDPLTVVEQARDARAPAVERSGRYLPFPDCSRIRIVRGTADVCFSADDLQAAQRQQVSAGQSVRVPSGDGRTDTVWNRVYAAFSRFVRTHEVEVEAKSRGLREDALRILPHGRMLPPAAPVAIDLTQLSEGKVERLTIARAGGTRRLLRSIVPRDGIVRIPNDDLAPGLSYAWTLETDKGGVEGLFYVLSLGEAADIEGGYRGSGDDALARAAYLQSQALEFDSERLIQAMTGRHP